MPMLDATKRRGAGFAVAWQTRKKDSDDVTYMYGLYEDVEGFFVEMHKCPEGARYGFELIRDSRECVSYADFEWEGDEDAEHSKMRHVISVVRSVFEKAHNRKAEVYVCWHTSQGRDVEKLLPPHRQESRLQDQSRRCNESVLETHTRPLVGR